MKNSVREHRTDKDFGPLFSGELLRDEGIDQVLKHNEGWMSACIKSAEFWVWSGGGEPFTGEDLRFYLSKTVGCPAHVNGWGALVNALLKKKIIQATGEYRPMKDETSHARKTPVYVKHQ